MEFAKDAVPRSGTTITIPEGDRLGGAGSMELLLTEVPHNLHPGQEWVHVKGIELENGDATDFPIAVVVRVALLRELAAAKPAKPESTW